MRNAEQLETVVCDACQLVPISVLSLDQPAPISGWEVMLRGRGVEVLEDDVGRLVIRRQCFQADGRRARFLVEEGPDGDGLLDLLARYPEAPARPARPYGPRGWLVEG